MPTIKSEFIIEGAVLAMQAAQISIRDAVKGYREGSHATATIMGAVALEHIGRCGWLINYAGKLGNSEVDCGTFAADFDKYASSGHEQRLQQSLYGFTSEMPPLDEMLEGLKEDDADFQEKAAVILRSATRQRNRAGSSYHELRQQAQYIERLDNCAGWSTPTKVRADEAHAFLMNVANSYGGLIWFGPAKNPAVLSAMKKMGVDKALLETNGLWPPPEGPAH